MKLLIFCLSSLIFTNLHALEVVTSDFPPYQTEKDGKIEGLTTDIVREVLSRAGFKENHFKMYPWPRAYKLGQREPNTLIYSIIRNSEREKLFKWIGVIGPYEVYYWKLASRKDIQIKTLADAKRYKNGGVFDDVKSQYLLSEGFVLGKNLELVSNDTLNLRKLFAGKIDLLASNDLSFPDTVKAAGFEVNRLSRLIRIEGVSKDLYLAASMNTPDETVTKLSNSLRDFKKTDRYRKIKSKFYKFAPRWWNLLKPAIK